MDKPPAALVWLEAKQVVRSGGRYKSPFFDDMTLEAAQCIRAAGLHKLMEVMGEEVPNEPETPNHRGLA